MTSNQSGSIPPDNFSIARVFVRSYETNKAPAEPCQAPASVTDLEISINNNTALLKWSEADCANSYRVEYTSGQISPDSWVELGVTSSSFMIDAALTDQKRFYRVVSLK